MGVDASIITEERSLSQIIPLAEEERQVNDSKVIDRFSPDERHEPFD